MKLSIEISGEVQTSEKTISRGEDEVRVDAENGSLCILLIEQAVHGLFNKALEDKGKSNLESQIDMLDDWKHKVIKQ